MDKTILGTKQSFVGPLDLVQSIRVALGDEIISNKKFLNSVPEHPGDKPQVDDTSVNVDSNDNSINNDRRNENGNNDEKQRKETCKGSAI